MRIVTEIDVAGVNEASLEILRANAAENCSPSPDSVAELEASHLVLVSGQFVGAGKSTFIAALEADGYQNIPSWVNRDLRPGEVDGVDKVHATLSQMAARATAGGFLELEELRPGMFYATPAIVAGEKYAKDLELKGALRLREFAPELPIIVPLPPLTVVEGLQVTEWERRVANREGYAKALGETAIVDLGERLKRVIDEVDGIEEHGLRHDPNTLLVVNDDLPTALSAMRTFLEFGEKPWQEGMEYDLFRMKMLASKALDALVA
jgi:guanylate kinase